MDSFSLIANSGIQLLTFRLKLNTQDKFNMCLIFCIVNQHKLFVFLHL